MAAENGTRNTGGRQSGERMTNQPKGRSMDGGYGKDREGVGRQDAGGYGSGKRPGTGTQRSGSRNMGRKKNSTNNTDRLTNIFLILLVLTIIVLAILYFKKEPDEPSNVAPTGQVQPGGTKMPEILTPEPSPSQEVPEPTEPEPTVTDTPETPDADATPEPTAQPSSTPEPTKEEEPTVEPTPEATPTPVAGGIDAEEANDILAGIFWEAGYRFTLSDSDFTFDGEEYFRYDVTFDKKAEDYDVLVHRESGDVFYYEGGLIREFDGLPEHVQQGGQEGGMTADAAAELLEEIPHTSLGLPAALDECSLALDNWKTVVDGEESYCLNVFYQGALAGNIYFTEDAEHVYYLDEFGEFVKVR